MFWRFGGYANISAIDTILDKAEFTLEELLDESDLIQELKQHNGKLLDYLRQRQVLEKLLEYVVAPKLEPVAVPDDEEEDGDDEKGKGRSLPFGRSRSSSRATDTGTEEEEAEKKRNKYAYVACEILSSDNWSICEALMEPSSRDLLQKFWTFLERPTPLDPLQASYFTKVNESLFDKKTEEMIDFLKTIDGAVPHMLRHVDSPMVMDLLLKIISLERTESGQGVVEWLYTQDLMPSLLAFLDPKHSWATQTSAGDFMKAIITVSANASQNEQTCIGPNELTRQLVSRPCVQQLINYMLGGGNALTVGVGIVIEVIRKNNSDYDPDVGAEANSAPSSRDPIYLGTLLRMFADNVPNFMNLIMNAPAQRARLESTFGDKIEPLGFDRFKTCELMAELLHCSNMGLLNEVGSEALIAARDSERQRLRDEGKLEMPGALRADEMPSSSEELTMRISHHSSPVDEGRRLEVTNASAVADDDGFEEVPAPSSQNPNAAEDEDTSHEFVKAEDELLPQLNKPMPPSSFLDKDDEDDFVDEPLSSPRLKVSDDKVAAPSTEEQRHFDDPELVVAPLSPSKRKPDAASVDAVAEGADKATEEGSKVEETTSKIEELSLEDSKAPATEGPAQPEDKDAKTAKEGETAEPSITFEPTVSAIAPAGEDHKKSEDSSLLPQHTASFEKELSPHPEDLPAPLFSSSPAKPAAVLATPVEPTEPVPLPAEEPEKEADKRPAEADQGDASIIVGHQPEAPPAPSAPEDHVEPVVGDYLKMQFVEHRVVPTILSFFFKYPWNNFLHNVVYDIVQQVFNGPMDRGYNPSLAVSLFEAADVTSKIIEGQLASEQSEVAAKTRMGYMGHLTLIAEEVVKFTERHPPELLSESVLDKVMAQDWINYVEGALAETRERDNAILGGVRPEVAMSNRAAGNGLAGVGLTGLGSALSLGGGGGQGSNALAEAGLNGGGLSDLQAGSESSSAGGPFSISAGISSSFHSSSDEDEDDDVGDEEDINNEFRNYTNPLSNDASSSLNPPSIPPPPPPPPPLNIPPSRARLQLAARLAMNKRNAEEAAAAAGGDGSGATGGEEGEVRGLQAAAPIAERLRNPFADDEDDDDDDLDDDDDDIRDDGSDDGNELGDRGPGGWRARGSWWRGVVRSRRAAGAGGSDRDDLRRERFGDGRDSDESSGDEVGVDEDEEFGDFAMPEVSNAPSVGGAGEGSGTVLVKPLAVHPPSGGASGTAGSGGASKFPSLWPFEGLGFGGSKGGEKEKDEGEGGAAGEGGKDVAVQQQEKKEEEPLEVLSEDGQRVSRAVEAKRRTSIEDPDEDEEQVVV